MEGYLHECLELLHRAGDDVGRRRKVIQRPRAWSLLPFEWRALAFLAANKAAPEAIGIEAGPGRSPSQPQRIGRRGGRGKVRSIDDRLAGPFDVLASDEPAAYKLAVLCAHKGKPGASWDASLDSQMSALRSVCEKGIHPVWIRLAREAPLLAEMAQFPVIEAENRDFDSGDWVKAACFDPLDRGSLREWLSMELPFATNSEQDHALQSIRQDLAGGRARPDMWIRWMRPSLRGLSGEGALLEGILLASASKDAAREVLGSLKGEGPGELASRHSMLIGIRSGELSEWRACADQEEDDGLSEALRVAAWRNVEDCAVEVSAKDLLNGAEVLSRVGESLPNTLRWRVASDLVSQSRASEALGFAEGAVFSVGEHASTALDILAEVESESLNRTLYESIASMDEDSLLMVMRHEEASIQIRLQAASKLWESGSIRHTDEILNMFTEAADIESLVAAFESDSSLSRAYPHRVLLSWHLLPGSSRTDRDSLTELRKTSLKSIDESAGDDVLSDASVALISLLDGLPRDMDSVHGKLDSDGLRSLNEVRRALSPDGDGVVRESKIGNLRDSIQRADLTHLERRLFDALIVALLLNRAAMDLQIGVGERESRAVQSLSRLCEDPSVAMRTIAAVTNLVIEHNLGVIALEDWYREHDKSGPEFQIVRAAILRDSGDRLNAARAYKDAAMKLRLDFERSALVLRKSLIEFAHAAGWGEAVSLIDAHPALSSSVSKRFKLYLRTCKDHDDGNTNNSSTRLIEFAAREEELTRNGSQESIRARRVEVLEGLYRYPDEHGLPPDPFQGRVRAALQEVRTSETSKQTDLERRFIIEMRGKKDPREITILAMEVADTDPINGLRMLEKAITSGELGPKEADTLKKSQRALFASHSGAIPVEQRRTLRSLFLKPLIMVDTNILIEALKDDLLKELSADSLGSLNWTVERAFHWMLRRRAGEGRVLLHIPPAARGEFMHRAKSPESVLRLFSDTYIDKAVWTEVVNDAFLKQRTDAICEAFDSWRNPTLGDIGDEIDLEDFLLAHREVFQLIDKQKRKGGKSPMRTSIKGEGIYPEKGDRDIMQDAAALASTSISDVGSVLVATRDSDFRLVSRALEEEYGFGVVGDAQQLNDRVL